MAASFAGRKAQLADAGVFFGRDRQLCVGVVEEPAFEDREHLFCALAGGADDEDVAEARFVLPIALEERRQTLGSMLTRKARKSGESIERLAGRAPLVNRRRFIGIA